LCAPPRSLAILGDPRNPLAEAAPRSKLGRVKSRLVAGVPAPRPPPPARAHPPALPHRGPLAPLAPAPAAAGEPAEERVRWGGTITDAHPGESETCLDVVASPLDARARPRPSDAWLGRFRACAPGFYDPAIYAPGRRVTVVGTIAAKHRTTVGEYELYVGAVDADGPYLWPVPIHPYAYTNTFDRPA